MDICPELHNKLKIKQLPPPIGENKILTAARQKDGFISVSERSIQNDLESLSHWAMPFAVGIFRVFVAQPS